MPKVATLSTNCKEKFRMIVLMTVSNFVKIGQLLTVFTCESSYCFRHVLAITILSVCLSVCPFVCPSACVCFLSVTQVDQSKTVQARITKFLPSAAWKTLVSGTVKLFHEFEGVTPNEGAYWEGVDKICDFCPVSRCISVTVRDRA